MRRRTPLRAAKAPARRTGTTLSTRVRPTVPTKVREALVARSGGRCEMGLVMCTRWATSVAHRVSPKTAVGRLSAVMYACRACHSWQESAPVEAADMGLRVEWQDPAREPVFYRGGRLVLLTDDGRVVDYLTPTGEVAV